jgi:Holliday junction resolvase RusA-like endonuclease
MARMGGAYSQDAPASPVSDVRLLLDLGATQMIHFTVNAIPIAQPRQRHAVIAGSVRNYTPNEHPVTAFKASCRYAAARAYDGPPLTGPLKLRLKFVMPRPKGLIWSRKPMPSIPHDKRPDADNLAKAVKDSLSGLCWRDDAQVYDLMVSKHYAAGDEQPHVVVTIKEDGE